MVISNIIGRWIRVKEGLLADVIAIQLYCVDLDYLTYSSKQAAGPGLAILVFCFSSARAEGAGDSERIQ